MTAVWEVRRIPQEQVTGDLLLAIARKHRLVFDNPERMVDYYRFMARDCLVLELLTEAGEKAADVIISDITDGEEATVDLAIVSKHYVPRMPDGTDNPVPVYDLTAAALTPLFDRLIEARGLRRLTACVPKSRNRTFRALLACGFEREGFKRKAIKLIGKDPEGLIIMGKLSKE